VLVGGSVWTGVAVAPATVWKGVREGVGVAVGAGVGEGVGVAVGAGVGEGVGVAVGAGVGVGVAVGVGVGVGVGVAMGAAAPSVVAHVNVRSCASTAVPEGTPDASIVPVSVKGLYISMAGGSVHVIFRVTSEPLTVPVSVQSYPG